MKSTFFIFRPEISFLGKFGPKTQNREFRLKLGTRAVPNMLNSMVKLIFFFFRPETLLLGRFGPKNSNCLFKVEFRSFTNSNMLNSMMMLIFSVLDQKYSFLEKLVLNFQSLYYNFIKFKFSNVYIQYWIR